MVTVTIDGKNINTMEGNTVLTAANEAGIHIPTLCYLKDVSEAAACRICLVEVEGYERLVAACHTMCSDGMVVRTNTTRVRKARKKNLELLLSQHHTACNTCVRDGNCKLQAATKELNMVSPVEETFVRRARWDTNEPLVRDDSKCVQCFRCLNVCSKVQHLSVWDIVGTGRQARIGIPIGKENLHQLCAFCGQCVTHCPTGALRARDDTFRVIDAINDPDIITVAQVAPAVRTAYGESLGLPPEVATEGRMAAAIRSLGIDYVFDTNFSADLTIMEEGSELIERLSGETDGLPMFTSCCPGWVRFMKIQYPELTDHLSTAKSPQQMFGAVTKSYFAEKIGVDPSKICCISIMPCMAKKYECDVEELNDAADKDVDIVLTTREFTRLLAGTDVASLPEEHFDSPLGSGSGAAVIFGATGGVMEAALRSACYLVEGKNPDPESFGKVRDADAVGAVRSEDERPWREAEYEIGGIKVRVAVTSGLENTYKLMDAIVSREVQYDFVEIMACPGGCAGGGGQPIHEGEERAIDRGGILYALDSDNPIRYSHENPDILELYSSYLEKPLSERSHHLLHTDQTQWTL